MFPENIMIRHPLILCSIALATQAPAAVLVDINADGTNRNATTAHFETAAGLSAGTFSGDSITYFPNNNPGGGSYSPTVDNITINISNIDNDADNWFGGGSDNNLLDDGIFHYTNGTETLTLSGSGLGLSANTTYELYLFAGRNVSFSGGHDTTFTFNVSDPENFAGGTSINTDGPVVGGDETLGTAMFTFTTGVSAPSSLQIGWSGLGADPNAAVLSGFALRTIPEPSSALLAILGLTGLITLRRRTS